MMIATKINPLRKPNAIPNNKLPAKLQPIVLVAFLLTKAPINNITANMRALANHILKVSEAIKDPNITAIFSSKLNAAHRAINHESRENNSDKNPLKNPYTVEIDTVPIKIKSNIDITSSDPKINTGKVTEKGKGIWYIIVGQEVIFDRNNRFFLTF